MTKCLELPLDGRTSCACRVIPLVPMLQFSRSKPKYLGLSAVVPAASIQNSFTVGFKLFTDFCHALLNCQALMPNVTRLNLSHNLIDTIEHLQVHQDSNVIFFCYFQKGSSSNFS